jgi:hypothetical protein
VVQVVERLLCKCKTLSAKPQSYQKKEGKKQKKPKNPAPVDHAYNLATQKAEIRKITVQSPISKKLFTKKGLVEWLKV